KPSLDAISIERLLPHRPPMLALDRLAEWSSDHSVATLTLRDGAPCFEAGRFRAIWCLELMAQAVGADVAYRAVVAEQPREAAGYVVGVEGLELLDAVALAPGDRLCIESRLEIEIPPAAELSARVLTAGGTPVASARLRMLVGGASPQPTASDAPRLEGFQGCTFNRDESSSQMRIRIGAGHPYLDGHFPGMPLLPAVGQLRLVEHAAEMALGRPCELAAVERARFLEPIVPGDSLELSLDLEQAPAIGWAFRRGGRPIAKGSGRLTSDRSEVRAG
ncbi:MAG: hypothetical protein HY901_13100, partial [Deltaproteobacteria bacterium]|nr:hypothetical protein [Deltaproteobacteria bacterium]